MRLSSSFILLLLLAGGTLAKAATRPITKEALSATLKRGGMSSAELADTIRTAGTAFAVTPADEQEWKALGADASVLEAIRQSRVADNVRGAARPMAPGELLAKLYHGNLSAAAAAVKVRGAGFALTPALEAQLSEAGADQALLGLVTLRRIDFEPQPAPVADAPAPPANPVRSVTGAGPKPIRVDAEVQAKKLARKSEPEFPQMAYRARLSGQVVVEALIGRDGRVRRVRPVRGDEVFVESARTAVSNYVYKPTFLEEQAVEVITEVTVSFSLGKAELGMKN